MGWEMETVVSGSVYLCIRIDYAWIHLLGFGYFTPSRLLRYWPWMNRVASSSSYVDLNSIYILPFLSYRNVAFTCFTAPDHILSLADQTLVFRQSNAEVIAKELNPPSNKDGHFWNRSFGRTCFFIRTFVINVTASAALTELNRLPITKNKPCTYVQEGKMSVSASASYQTQYPGVDSTLPREGLRSPAVVGVGVMVPGERFQGCLSLVLLTCPGSARPVDCGQSSRDV